MLPAEDVRTSELAKLPPEFVRIREVVSSARNAASSEPFEVFEIVRISTAPPAPSPSSIAAAAASGPPWDTKSRSQRESSVPVECLPIRMLLNCRCFSAHSRIIASRVSCGAAALSLSPLQSTSRSGSSGSAISAPPTPPADPAAAGSAKWQTMYEPIRRSAIVSVTFSTSASEIVRLIGPRDPPRLPTAF